MKSKKKIISIILCFALLVGIIPAETLSYAINALSNIGVGSIIEIGSYPQSKVTDESKISELNELISDDNWVSYGYYSGNGTAGSAESSDYMKYADVELDNSKYRAIVIENYRPDTAHLTSGNDSSAQDDNEYSLNTVYWFKFEPIKWRVLNKETGLLLSESVIDSQAFSDIAYLKDSYYYSDADYQHYLNNYENSSIRAWLNNEFYNTAFSDDEKAKINEKTYESPCYDRTTTQFDSPGVQDKVVLPSTADMKNVANGFTVAASPYNARIAHRTDYADAQGVINYSGNPAYWLRNAATDGKGAKVMDVGGDGGIYSILNADCNSTGVRPLITITNLSDFISLQEGKVYSDADFSHYGEKQFTDSTFIYSNNGVVKYNTSNNSTVSVKRTEKDNTCPTESQNVITVKTAGVAEPGLGGFSQKVHATAGAEYYHVIIAKIPVGYELRTDFDNIGFQGHCDWLTSNIGTGNWALYIYKITCGLVFKDKTDIGSFGYVYLHGEPASKDNPVEWTIGYANIFGGNDGLTTFGDPEFSFSKNYTWVYNNKQNSSVSLDRERADESCPNSSGYMLHLRTDGTARPYLGGYCHVINPKKGCTYYHKIIAKIPVGYNIGKAYNVPIDGTYTWLTPVTGTGDWQTYVYKLDVDSEAQNLSSFGYAFVRPDGCTEEHADYTTTEPMNWYVCYSEIFLDFNTVEHKLPTVSKADQTYLYDLYDIPLTWHQAKDYCEKLGGHLATIINANENAVIESLASTGTYWLGATDEVKEGQWKWVTGESFSYNDWGGGQPDNSGSNEHCLEIWENDNVWNDDQHQFEHGFVCEFVDEPTPGHSIVYNNHIYSLYNRHLSWTDAEAKCISVGGHLASVTSEEEQKVIESLLDYGGCRSYWLGANDVNGSWVWSTGESFSYNKWAAGEPNNSTSSAGTEHYCHIYNTGSTRTYWNDVINNYTSLTTGYICEVDLGDYSIAKSEYYKSNQYLKITNPRSWCDAESLAERLGGHLVTITDAEENTFVKSMVAGDTKSYWIGASRVSPGGAFQWVTGEKFIYNDWAAGEPNNSGSMENVAHLYVEKSFQWNDAQASGGFGFIVEIENARSVLTLSNPDGTEIDHCYAINNELLNIPAEPTRENYSFGGWYRDKNCTDEWNFESDYIYDDTTLYAKWIPDSYQLTFNANGGQCSLNHKDIFFELPIGELPIPQREGYTFWGWYTEQSGGTKICSEDIVNSAGDRIVYACWSETASLKCGDNLTWTLDGNKVIISGTGEIYDYSTSDSPWSKINGYINEVTVSNGITSIGSNAFNNCTHLTTIDIGKDVSSIGEAAFYHCSSLNSFIVPDKVEVIASNTFAGCSKLRELSFGINIQNIENGAIDNCNALNKITVLNPNCKMPENWQNTAENVVVYGYTGSYAETFANNNNVDFEALGSCGIYDNYTWIYTDSSKVLQLVGEGELPDYAQGSAPWHAFAPEIEKAVISSGITYIGNNTFNDCIHISNVVIPKSVTNLGKSVFEDTAWFQSKPAGLISINNMAYAFKAGEEPSNIVLGNGITKLLANFSNSTAENKDMLESIQISASVKHIADGSLANFKNLSSIIVNKGNKNYKSNNNVVYSFDGKEIVACSTSIDNSFNIPNGVTTIRSKAFCGCTDLTDITLSKNVTSIAIDVFENSGLTTIHGYVNSYAQNYAEENGFVFSPFVSKVTFFFNDENETQTELTINTGERIGELPPATKEGYRLVGWFLESDTDDIQIDKDFIVNEDISLHAYWEAQEEEKPVVTDVSITSLPTDLTYFVGEDLDTKGLQLTITYSDGNVEVIENGFSCVPGKLTKAGNQQISVLYNGFTNYFNVSVSKVVPVSLSINTLPDRLSYYVSGDEDAATSFAPDGIVCTVSYNNGTQKKISDSTIFEYQFDFSSVSDSSQVDVIYRENGETVRAFYQVKVLKRLELYSSTIVASSGDEIAVPVYLRGNTGIAGFSISLSYDSSLLTPIDKSIGFSSDKDISWNYGYNEDGKINLLWYDTEEMAEDGLLFTVYFKVNAQANDTTTNIDISYSSDDCFNEDFESIEFDCGISSVIINEKRTPTIYGESSYFEEEHSVELIVKCSNNIGLDDMAMITVDFDANIFDYTSYENAEASILKVSKKNGKLTILLNEFADTHADGDMFVLHFNVADKVEGEYLFDINVDNDNWSTISTKVSIANTEKNPVISAKTINAVVGENVRIPVYISSNCGIMGYKLSLTYDESVFEIVKVSPADGWKNNFDYQVHDNGTIDIIWIGNENINANGCLFILEAKSIASVEPGEYSLGLQSSLEDTYNEKWENINIECHDITLNLKESETSVIQISNDVSELDSNNYFNVSVNFDNNPGIMGYKLSFNYDRTIIRPISVTCGAGFTDGQLTDTIGIKDGEFDVLWNSPSNCFATGQAFVIQFEQLSNVQTSVEVSYSQEDTFNENGKDVVLEYNDIIIEAVCIDHEFIIKSQLPANCLSEGEIVYICSKCSYEYTEIIPALGHTPAILESTAPTCTIPGLTEGSKCSVCGEILTAQQEIPALGHAYVEEITKAATCEESGIKTYTCSRCNDSYNETISALGHNWEDWNVILDPTCAAEGLRIRVCKNNATHIEREAVDKLAHTPVTLEAVAPTCTAPGLTEGSKCSVCGEILTAQQEIPALGHAYVEEVTKSATCEATGTKAFTCSRCNDSYSEVIPALGHDWGEWVVTKAATCTEEGIETKTCSRDATHVQTRPIEKLAHTIVSIPAVEATCTAPGLTEGSKCSVCGEILMAQQKVPALGHAYVEEITKAATCEESGTKTFTCSRCNDSYNETISALGHNWEDWNVILDPTCAAEGLRIRVCKNDASHIEREAVEKLAHTSVKLEAVAPTCTAPGLTEGSKCSVCGEILTAQQEVPALGHQYIEEITKAATCEDAGTKTYTCSRCNDSYDEVIPALGHNWGEWVVTKAATCTEEGIETKTCSRDATHVQTRPIEVLGHTVESIPAVAPTCTKPGLTEGSKCSVCGEILTAQQEVPALGHAYVEEITKAATCEESGTKTYTCSRCNDSYSETIPVLGHNWEDWNVIVDPTCSAEGLKIRVCKNDATHIEREAVEKLAHTPVKLEAVAPTCTTPGLTEGSKCSVCGEILTAQQEVPALGHQYTETITKEASYEEDGIKTFSCSRCGHSYTEPIPALKHTPVILEAVAPTCTTPGLTEGSKCSVCGEILTAQQEIPALGHAYVEEITKAATCEESGTKTFTCSRCNDSYNETISALGHNWEDWNVILDPTCAAEGLRIRVCKNDASHIEREAVEKLAHTSVKLEAVAPTCTAPGLTEGSKCSVCGEILTAQQEVPALGHQYTEEITKAATCEDAGTKTYTCSLCNDSYDEVIPALGHNWGEWVVTKAATCTEEGIETKTCSRDATHVQTRPIEVLGHTAESIPAVAPTCTAPGLTEGSKCSVCGEILTAQREVPALGHAYVEEITKAATCEESGTKTYTCSRCNDSYSKTISALGHNWGEWNVIVDSTCATEGLKIRVCKNDVSHIERKAVEKLMHTPVTLEAVAPTCTVPGLTEGSKCSVCGEILTAQQEVPALGHQFTEEIKSEDALRTPKTMEQPATYYYTCARCGQVEHNDEHFFTDNSLICVFLKLETVIGRQAELTLLKNGEKYVSSSKDGTFAFEDLTPGNYQIFADSINGVKVEIQELILNIEDYGKVIELQKVIVPLGDVNEDEVIDISDIALLLSADVYGHKNAQYDLNDDGYVDIADLSVILATVNYGRAGVSINN